ncbi:MAG: hypothetical protein QOE92_91 [Chloroflexota bacterium]|jgi:RNA polymerase sigma-70 factor (ECF subfamily)|nr:hypothetical protein [Chloroflexota bacterium]
MTNRALVETDADLYRPLLEGHPDALADIYDRYGGLAYGLALRILGDPQRAEEVVQDAFTRLWRNPASYDPTRGAFRSWFLTMVRNRSIDVLRGRGGRERGEVELPVQLRDASPASDPWQALSVSLERTTVREALESLPENQRQVVELAYMAGYTHAEIASNLDLPLGTVKGRMRLAMEKLHSYLTGRGFIAT